MRLNEDGKTVAAMDVLVRASVRSLVAPSVKSVWTCWRAYAGNGPEQRRLLVVSRSARYGTVPHSGFGLGFERLIAS